MSANFAIGRDFKEWLKSLECEAGRTAFDL